MFQRAASLRNLGCLLAWLVAAPPASAAPNIVVSGDLHSGPGTTTPIVDKLRPGTDIGYVLRRGQWLALRNGRRLAWVQAIDGLPVERSVSTGRCADGDRVEPAPRTRVNMEKPTRLRDRFGRERDRDRMLPRGTMARVNAADRNSDWVIIETSKGALGWVRRCEIAAGRSGAAGDEVVVVRAGDLRSSPSKRAKRVKPLIAGARLTADRRTKDWVLLTGDDGIRGWFPADALEWHAAEEHDPDYPWQSGMTVSVDCSRRSDRDAAVRCGDHARVLRAAGDEKRPLLLVATDDGYWDWIDERVTPIEIGRAVVKPASEPPSAKSENTVADATDAQPAAEDDTARTTPKPDRAPATADRTIVEMAAMQVPKPAGSASTKKWARAPTTITFADLVAPSKTEINGVPATTSMHADPSSNPPTVVKHGAADDGAAGDDDAISSVAIGMADRSPPAPGATVGATFQTVFPVESMLSNKLADAGVPATDIAMLTRSPRYELALTGSGAGRVGPLEVGLGASFFAAGSLTNEGQSRGERSQGGQAGLSLAHAFGKVAKLAVTGGYSLAFAWPSETANAEWLFIAFFPGPFGRVSLSGVLGSRLMYSLRGTAQLTDDTMGGSLQILTGDAIAMCSITDWLAAGVDGTAMSFPMGLTMLSGGPSISLSLYKRLSVKGSLAAMNYAGITMWNATTGVGIHF